MRLPLSYRWAYLLLLLATLQNSLDAAPWQEPWGKDAALACQGSSKKNSTEACQTPIFGAFAETMIRFHQDVVSPADGPRSHFIPSSSQYTLNAMRKYGFCQGVAMGCDRLMRENEDHWVYRWTRDGGGKLIKYDPVP